MSQLKQQDCDDLPAAALQHTWSAHMKLASCKVQNHVLLERKNPWSKLTADVGDDMPVQISLDHCSYDLIVTHLHAEIIAEAIPLVCHM